MDKRKTQRKNRKQNQRGTVRAEFWHMYIASLQVYKQMYNNYIINKLLIWDGEEPASHVSQGGLGWLIFFFHLFLFFVTVWRSCERRRWGKFFSMRSTRTPLRCGGRNPSNPSSPCLLSGGWRCLCCSPSSSCARSLCGGEAGEVTEGVGRRGREGGGAEQENSGLETLQSSFSPWFFFTTEPEDFEMSAHESFLWLWSIYSQLQITGTLCMRNAACLQFSPFEADEKNHL